MLLSEEKKIIENRISKLKNLRLNEFLYPPSNYIWWVGKICWPLAILLMSSICFSSLSVLTAKECNTDIWISSYWLYFLVSFIFLILETQGKGIILGFLLACCTSMFGFLISYWVSIKYFYTTLETLGVTSFRDYFISINI